MSDQELTYKVNEIYYQRPDFGPKRKRLIPDKALNAFATLWAIFALAFLALSAADVYDSTTPEHATTNIAPAATSTTTDSALEKAVAKYCRDNFNR